MQEAKTEQKVQYKVQKRAGFQWTKNFFVVSQLSAGDFKGNCTHPNFFALNAYLKSIANFQSCSDSCVLDGLILSLKVIRKINILIKGFSGAAVPSFHK